jgi:poly-gamma-glutamate system protein
LKRIFSDARAWSRRTEALLIALAVLGLGLHALSQATRRMNPQPFLKEKMAAASRTLRCFEAIREARLGTPASLDQENDPGASGLIGQEFTLTTTDRGVLEAKLTSVNPNFAAVFVQYFHDLGLRPGDPVAIAMTGSFPALNIAVVAAAEEMRLKPIVTASVGSSMWGANEPDFTWLDMERLLCEKNLIKTRSVAASIGGSNDRGRGLSPKGRAMLKEAIERNGVVLISEPILEQSIAKRLEIYGRESGARGVRAFVNIGGGSASTGTQQNADLIKPGISRVLPDYNWTQQGLIHKFAKMRIPIIHILNVDVIAREHGLPLTPEVMPPVGEGDIFFRQAYDLRIVIPAFLTYLVFCFGVLRARHRAAVSARDVTPSVASPASLVNPAEEGSRG